jgi:hypothetical protein
MAEQAAIAADQAAFGVRAANTRDAFEIVATGAKSLAELLDALQAVPTIGGGVLLIVEIAEIGEVSGEYGMEFVAAMGNIPVCRPGRNGDRRAHMNVYGGNRLLAAREGGCKGRHITSRIHQTPSRRFAPARAQVMRVVIRPSNVADFPPFYVKLR